MTTLPVSEDHCYYNSPLGLLYLSTTFTGINKLKFVDDLTSETVLTKPSHPLLVRLISELENYFSGSLKKFTVPLNPNGTDFQKKVWEAVSVIPYGQVVSYAKLSDSLHQPEAIRAVANSNARNPLLILVPCHRVIGSNGDLTGYAGGLTRKKLLLEREGALHQLSLDLH